MKNLILDLETKKEETKESINLWIKNNLQKGGIESKIEKLINLMSIVGEQFLISHQYLVENVASTIECEGYNHKII